MIKNLILIILSLIYVLSIDLNHFIIKKNIRVEIQVIDDLQRGKLVGCKFQNICSKGRSCYNDNLFGTCLRSQNMHNFVYKLSPRIETIMGQELKRLWQNGFQWSDFYTQCIVQSIIKISQWKSKYDVSHCYPEIHGLDKRFDNEEDFILSIYQSLSESMVDRKGQKDIVDNKLTKKETPLYSNVHNRNNHIAKRGFKTIERPNDWVWVKFDKFITPTEEDRIANTILDSLHIADNLKIKSFISQDRSTFYFQVPVLSHLSTTNVTASLSNNRNLVNGLSIIDIGVIYLSKIRGQSVSGNSNLVIILVLCSLIVMAVGSVLVCFCVRTYRYRRDKLGDVVHFRIGEESTSIYQDLFRTKKTNDEKKLKLTKKVSTKSNKPSNEKKHVASSSESTRNSLSYWADDTSIDMDIPSGQMIVSFVARHLLNQDLFMALWDSIQSYEDGDHCTEVATSITNRSKNRYQDMVPCDKSRVVLKKVLENDYINASMIYDSDTSVPSYILTQTPLENTVADFWQMIWEQDITGMINLTEAEEVPKQRYWPVEGCEVYGMFEVRLTSEDKLSDEFLVRNFCLKNLENSDSKTVTQFHFFAWPIEKIPSSVESILGFRREVNKWHRSNSSPILVHCNDGCGRSGSYVLLDVVLNRIGQGTKDMDIVATLGNLRDQRVNLVTTKEQFGFVLNAISEEVTGVLKGLGQ